MEDAGGILTQIQDDEERDYEFDLCFDNATSTAAVVDKRDTTPRRGETMRA